MIIKGKKKKKTRGREQIEKKETGVIIESITKEVIVEKKIEVIEMAVTEIIMEIAIYVIETEMIKTAIEITGNAILLLEEIGTGIMNEIEIEIEELQVVRKKEENTEGDKEVAPENETVQQVAAVEVMGEASEQKAMNVATNHICIDLLHLEIKGEKMKDGAASVTTVKIAQLKNRRKILKKMISLL
jgi:hypothetical protein